MEKDLEELCSKGKDVDERLAATERRVLQSFSTEHAEVLEAAASCTEIAELIKGRFFLVDFDELNKID